MSKELQHINRRLNDEERRLAEEIQEGAVKDFPPRQVAEPLPPAGIAHRIHAARQARKITRYELGRLSNVP